ncbi:MAG TPA: VanZ family protein, partial [Clostridiales bacterium]|nr:VanZ family protein [Clostridiales bacterium]
MRTIYSVTSLGILLLAIYILFDFFKNNTRNLISRIVFYTFIFYMCVVFQLTSGGISIPPSKGLVGANFQLIPFRFVFDLIDKAIAYGIGYRFITALKLYFFNFLMLMPFGLYLNLYFNVKSLSKAALIILTLVVGIEIFQAIFSEVG